MKDFEMTDFSRIMEGLEEAAAITRGEADPTTYRVHVPVDVDVKAIRKKLKLTQAEFSARFGFSHGAVRDWEQKRRRPEASARAFLLVIDREPAAVDRALSAA
jgi:putative transcriptional regulator